MMFRAQLGLVIIQQLTATSLDTIKWHFPQEIAKTHLASLVTDQDPAAIASSNGQ